MRISRSWTTRHVRMVAVLGALSIAPPCLGADTSAPQPSMTDEEIAKLRSSHGQKISLMLLHKLKYDPDIAGQKCKVELKQDMSGHITELSVLECESEKLRKAVVGLISRSSPLLLPADPRAIISPLRLTFVAAQ